MFDRYLRPKKRLEITRKLRAELKIRSAQGIEVGCYKKVHSEQKINRTKCLMFGIRLL